MLQIVIGLIFVESSATLAGNVSQLTEGRGFTTNVDTKHTVQIYEKLSYELLHRHFCKTRVTSWRSVCRVVKVKSDKGFAVRLLLLCRLCVGGFKNFRREGNFKK